jgi:hypothetical protein
MNHLIKKGAGRGREEADKYSGYTITFECKKRKRDLKKSLSLQMIREERRGRLHLNDSCKGGKTRKRYDTDIF